MQNYPKAGYLINEQDVKLHRKYFEEMCDMIGIKVIYKAPRKDKKYTQYGEFDTNYYEPLLVGCIFEEHPQQQTMKKLGWVSELDAGKSIIHVPYNLPELQEGALFIIPSGIDNAQGRVFRLIKLSNIMLVPASITCEIAPEYDTSFDRTQLEDFKRTDFNLLNEEEED